MASKHAVSSIPISIKHRPRNDRADRGFHDANEDSDFVPVTHSMHALRLVLAVAFDRQSLSNLVLGTLESSPPPIQLWPSSLYQMAAEIATHSLASWNRIEKALDARLDPWAGHYFNRPPVETVQVIAKNPEVLHGLELAGALWAILRRREPALSDLANRFASELELIAMQQFGKTPFA